MLQKLCDFLIWYFKGEMHLEQTVCFENKEIKHGYSAHQKT